MRGGAGKDRAGPGVDGVGHGWLDMDLSYQIVNFLISGLFELEEPCKCCHLAVGKRKRDRMCGVLCFHIIEYVTDQYIFHSQLLK